MGGGGTTPVKKCPDVCVGGLKIYYPPEEERGVLCIGSIPVAIPPSFQNMKLLHYDCINMNMVG